MSLGRKTRHDPVQAYGDIHPNARIAGVFGVAAAFLILSYYSVIGGWIIKYIVSYGTTFHAPEDFEAFISAPVEPTAAIASLPVKRPTTTMSAALNSSCKMPEIISGMAKTRIFPRIGPLHISSSYDCFIAPILF